MKTQKTFIGKTASGKLFQCSNESQLPPDISELEAKWLVIAEPGKLLKLGDKLACQLMLDEDEEIPQDLEEVPDPEELEEEEA